MSQIICERRKYEESNNIHTHKYGQLILPISGNLNIETTHKKLNIDNNKIFLLPPDCEHLFNAKKNNEFLVLDIPTNFLKKSHMSEIAGGQEVLFDDKWKAVRYLFLEEINKKNSSTSINNLFLYSYNLLMEDREFESIKYIDNHFAEDIDLKKLADIEHYNNTYYVEWFKKKTGFSPMEYIQNKRIEKSKELLLNTDLNILQVGEAVGYKHNSSFTRVFKKLENITPKEFRLNSK